MKSSTRKKIISAIRTRLEEILGPGPRTLPASYREAYASVAKGLRGKVDDTTLQRAFQSGVMLAMWTEAEHGLRGRPEPTSEQMKNILAEIEILDFASIMRTSIKNISRKLPKVPRGKRSTLNSNQQKEALTKVRELRNREGLSQKKAYETVAQGYGVHWRTIQNLSVRTGKGSLEEE